MENEWIEECEFFEAWSEAIKLVESQRFSWVLLEYGHQGEQGPHSCTFYPSDSHIEIMRHGSPNKIRASGPTPIIALKKALEFAAQEAKKDDPE